MFTLRERQVEAFTDEALARFADRMVRHALAHFPEHLRAAGEPGIRALIHDAHRNAARYGLDSERSVCLYLNSMLVFGAGFDRDPVYPWAAEVLHSEHISQRARADLLADRTSAAFAGIAGPRHADIMRALVRLRRDRDLLRQRIFHGTPADLPELAAHIFPRKAAVAGPAALRTIAHAAVVAAEDYGFTRPPHQLLYALLMFSFGSGFATDPQFSELRHLLEPAPAREEARAVALFAAALAYLERFLARASGAQERPR